MDRQLAERLVGAACLLAVLVFLVPSILDGNGGERAGRDSALPAPESAARSDGALDLRTHTISLDGAERAPPIPRTVAKPVQAGSDPDPSAAKSQSPAVPGALAGAATDDERARTTAGTEAPEPAPGSIGPASAPSAAAKPSVSPGTAAPQAPPASVDSRSTAPAAGAASPAGTAGPSAAKPPAPAVKAPPSGSTSGSGVAAGSGWVVQLGSFSSRDNADRLAAQIRSRGFTVSVSPLRTSGGTLHRVRTTASPERSTADSLQKKLAAAGHRGQVVRN